MVQVEDSERQICKVDFEYEGLWVEGTTFYHRCLRSEAQTYRKPLQYTVRWFMEVEVHERMRRREILRETRTVPVCDVREGDVAPAGLFAQDLPYGSASMNSDEPRMTQLIFDGPFGKLNLSD